MEKFVGTVNGKTFDNEKDFNAAARAAIKENDGSLSISSYYKSVSDENEVKDEERDASNDLSPKDYSVLNSDAPYVLSDELTEKLNKATNKTDVLKKVKEDMDSIDTTIVEKVDEVNDIKEKILALKKVLDEKLDDVKDLKAKKRYYNNIVNTLQNNNFVGRAISGNLSDVLYDLFRCF